MTLQETTIVCAFQTAYLPLFHIALLLLGASQGYGFTLEVGMSEIKIMKLVSGSRFMLDVLQTLDEL